MRVITFWEGLGLALWIAYFSYPATNLMFSFTLACNTSAFCGKLTAEYLLSTNEPKHALSNLLLNMEACQTHKTLLKR